MLESTATIPLSRPLELSSGEKVETLQLREPTALDMRGMAVTGELTVGDLLDLAASVAGVPQSALNQLSAVDTLEVVKAMGKFMGGGTGAKP